MKNCKVFDIFHYKTLLFHAIFRLISIKSYYGFSGIPM